MCVSGRLNKIFISFFCYNGIGNGFLFSLNKKVSVGFSVIINLYIFIINNAFLIINTKTYLIYNIDLPVEYR